MYVSNNFSNLIAGQDESKKGLSGFVVSSQAGRFNPVIQRPQHREWQD